MVAEVGDVRAERLSSRMMMDILIETLNCLSQLFHD